MPGLPEGFSDKPPDPALPQVEKRESGGRNLPPEANYDFPRSHASGYYQDQPQTWRDWSKASGIGTQYAEAYQAPREVQTAVNEWGRQKYGVNASETWQASAPKGGYKALPVGFSAEKPQSQKLPEGFGATKPAPQGEAWRVPPANEGPREKINLSPQTDLPQRPAGAIDPSIEARQADVQAGRTAALAHIVGPLLTPWLGAEWAKHAPPDALSNALSAGTDKAYDFLVGALKQPLPGLAPKVGMTDTQANSAARDIMVELTRRGGELAPEAIKSPAVKTADGRVVEGPNHAAIESAGSAGEPGFTTSKGGFVNREQGAKIAQAVKQADPEVQSLHSEDLHPVSVGAAASDKAILDMYKAVPPTPTKAFIGSTDDSFFRLRQAATADKAQFDNFVRSLPPELRDAGLQERMYNFKEGDGSTLSPEEQALYDKYVVPLNREEEDLYGELKKFNPDLAMNFDPSYVHRMIRGKSREFDPWMGEAGESASPISGYKSRSASSLKDRVYYAIESASGQRKVVAVTDHGTMVLNKGQPATPLPRYQGQATAPGDKFSINGEPWSVKQAKTSEIEHHTDLKYYKNAMASTIKNVVQLRAAARATAEIARLKSTPEWAAYTRPLTSMGEKGWETVNFPPFRDRLFQPQFAHVLNDFWAAKKPALGEKLAAINRFAVGSLFWSPVPHALNAGAHWVSARGWDWVTPQGLRSVAMDTAKAIREVVTQGPEYQRMLRDGSGMVYGSVANEQFYRTILKRLGESVQTEPWKWDPIARALGVGPSDLVKGLYNVSSRALWSMSDMMMMQRVFELERKGMSARDAIADAEKHIPNYRIPPQVLGSRMFAAALKDPSLTVFSRYHYGQWKSLAHMARDLAVGTPTQKFAAAGNVLATGILLTLVGPIINQAIQRLTGSKDVEMGPKGSTTIPVSLYDAWHGKPIEQVIQGAITLAPAPKMLYEGLTNSDWFTKRSIAEPADMEQHRFGRIGAQIGEKAAQDALSPYGTAAQAAGKGGLAGAAEGLAKQGLGLRKPFKPYHGRTGGGTPQQQSNYRRAHPRGPIEALEKRAEQWLKEPAR